jgi:predicted esterase
MGPAATELMVALALALLLQAASAPPVAKAVPGEIAEAIPCASSPKLTYALYLPKHFTPEKQWPILYVLDPRGRGRLAAELFEGVAERRGFLIASSNDTESDNPKAPNTEVINALWRDTHERLPIDATRVYATGFSGGARLACSLGLALAGRLAGVIAVGGGFPSERPPAKGLAFALFGTVGTRDFNYYEMRDLDATLGKLGVPKRLEIWDGGHDWPPVEIAAEAVEWMDLIVMKMGAIARDEGLVESFYKGQVERAAALEAKGQTVEAWTVYDATARDLDGLRDVAPLRSAAERLRKAGVDEELKHREKQDRRDAAVNARNSAILETIRSGDEPPPLGRALNDLDVAGLLKLAQQDSYEGQSAARRLAHILVETSYYLPRGLMERGEYRRAITMLQIAAAIRPANPYILLDLARALIRQGAKRDALDALGRAVDDGFDDRASLQADADFAALRGEPEYKKLLERIKPAAATP